MHMRYLLALATLPAFVAVAQAQGPVQPPPPPTPAPSTAPAPTATPTKTTVEVSPAAEPAPAGPPPAGPAPAPAAAGNETLSPDFTAPAPSVSATPDVVNGVLPRAPGSDAIPSIDGPVGLLRTSAAEVGAPLQLRMGLSGRVFSKDSFLIENDRDLRLQGALSIGFTPVRFLELFASVSGSANRNRRVCMDVAATPAGPGGVPPAMPARTVCNSEAGRNDPEVIKSYGDLTFGGKFAYPLSGGISAGGELGLRLLSSVTGLSFNPDATSVWLSGLTTWDMHQMGVPLRTHLNLGLYFDNSDAVQNYRGVSRPSKAVSQFAYGIAKDRVRGALAGEFAIPNLGPTVGLTPFLEYHLEVITAVPDPTFDDYRPPACKPNPLPGQGTACRDNRDQQWLTLGLRTQIKGTFAITTAVDLALHSVGFPYGPPLPSWEVSLGLAYPFDLAAPRVVTKTVVLERRIPGEKAIEGFAVGKVIAAPNNTPVEGAIVSVTGRPKSRVATDPDGSFKTAALPVGVVDLEVNAPGFQGSSVRTAITAGQEVPVSVTLTPRVKSGKVSGKITDPAGKAVAAAVVRFSGPQEAEVKTDLEGAFSTTLSGGAYVIRVEAPSFLGKDMKLDVADGQEQDASISLRSKPTGPSKVTVNNGKLSVRSSVSFKGSGSKLEVTPASAAVLDELAGVLTSHPEIRRVRIEAHWDTSLPKEKAQELTEQQARAVATYLTRQGVAADRIQMVGMGADKPIVPNIGMAKMRNRRVEFRAVN